MGRSFFGGGAAITMTNQLAARIVGERHTRLCRALPTKNATSIAVA